MATLFMILCLLLIIALSITGNCGLPAPTSTFHHHGTCDNCEYDKHGSRNDCGNGGNTCRKEYDNHPASCSGNAGRRGCGNGCASCGKNNGEVPCNGDCNKGPGNKNKNNTNVPVCTNCRADPGGGRDSCGHGHQGGSNCGKDKGNNGPRSGGGPGCGTCGKANG